MDQNPSKPPITPGEIPPSAVAGDLPADNPENPRTSHIKAKRTLDATVKSTVEEVKEIISLLSPIEDRNVSLVSEQVNLQDVLNRAGQLTFQTEGTEDFTAQTHQSLITSESIIRDMQTGISIHRQKITEYDSRLASLEKEKEEMRTKRRQFNTQGFLAKARNSKTGKEIESKLDQIEKQIAEVESEQGKMQAELERAESTLKTISDLRTEVAGKSVERAVKDISEKYDEFKKQLLADPTIKEELNETFLENELLPRLKEAQEEKTIPREVIDKYLTLVKAQLAEGTGVRVNDSPEKRDRIKTLEAQMKEIYDSTQYGYALEQLRYCTGLYSPWAGTTVPDEGYEQLFDLLIRNEEFGILTGLSQNIQEMQLDTDFKSYLSSIIERKIDTGEKQFTHTSYGDEPIKTQILDIDKIAEEALDQFFLNNAGLQRWEIIQKWEGTGELFGDDGFTKLEKKIQDKSIRELLVTPDHTDKALTLGYRLLKFQNAEVAPYVIMNCWRESGHSGEMPFLDSRARNDTYSNAAHEYIAKLSDEELDELSKMGIPGVMDVIKLVRENPYGFLSTIVQNPKWETFVTAYGKKYGMGKEEVEEQMEQSKTDPKLRNKVLKVAQSLGIDYEKLEEEGDQIDNPTRIAVENNLAKMCLHLMSTGDENRQFFVMHLLEKLQDAQLGKEGYEMLSSILINTQNKKLQEALLETTIRRYDDLNAALAIVKAYPRLGEELKPGVAERGPELLTRFIKADVNLEDADISGLASLLETNPEDLRLMINFVREIDSLSKEGSWRSSYEHKNFSEFVQLAKQPEILPLIKELTPFGYEFAINHSEALQEILANRDKIFPAIQELKSAFPDYTYYLDYVFLQNPAKHELVQVFITNPYELKIQKLLDQSHWKMEVFFGSLRPLLDENGTLPRKYSDGLLHVLRLENPKLNIEDCRNIDEENYKFFHEAFQKIYTGTMTAHGIYRHNPEFFQNRTLLYFLAKNPQSADAIFSLATPECLQILSQKDMQNTLAFIFDKGDILLKNVDDAQFLANFVSSFNYDTEYFLNSYLEGLEKGIISVDNRNQFIEKYRSFSQTFTPFNIDRLTQFQTVSESAFGIAITDLIQDEVTRNQIIFDYACYKERLETNKMNLINKEIPEGRSASDIALMFEYMRWLPDSEVTPQDNLATLAQKYQTSHDRLKTSFQKVFPSSETFLKYPENIKKLNQKLEEICARFRMKSRRLVLGNFTVTLPEDFIKEFNKQRRVDPNVQFVPELASYITKQISKLGSAYTTEDLMYSQIGETEDTTGRRRGQYSSEKLLREMESNIEASLITWSTATDYQQEVPESPLFIIANERTGPADLAAEYLPKDFAQRFKVAQNVNYDKFFTWFRENESFIDQLYDNYLSGKDVSDQIPQEVLSFLDIKDHSIIPIYRLKVPSSLNAATDEPEGIETVLNFLKLSKILDGRVLFMDESTRSAPRSIECLYNVIKRRSWVGAKIRFLGKLNGATGQNGTKLEEYDPLEKGLPEVRMEIGFIDPWKSSTKSMTDDSEGFVPLVAGKGIVEIVRPSNTSVSPFGIGTIQDFWKQMVANEVALRFDEFKASGGLKKSKEEFRQLHEEVAKTQEELKEAAFSLPYKALILDLDGTIGSRGEYNPKIIEKIKELAGNGTDVVIGTARSFTDHEEYDGSVKSFIEKLGDLSEEQKSHILLGTEGGAIITSLSNTEEPQYATPIAETGFDSIESAITSLSKDFKSYREKATIVVRGFSSEEKTGAIERIQREIDRLGLAFQVTSDTRHSIHIRPKGTDKRKILNLLESKTGIGLNDIAKIGDSPEGNDRAVLIGRGAFNVGISRNGTIWTIHMDEYGGGPTETEHLLEKLSFAK